MKINKVLIACTLFATSLCAIAGDKNITINSAAHYHDEKVIQANVLAECKSLGSQFSVATKNALEKNGWTVNLSDNINKPINGTKLQLKITNAFSGRGALWGHKKSVAIEASLYKNNKLVDTFNATRNSNGGFGAGFKSSCDILQRCTNTLGKDVSQWMKKQNL
jgi:hypothetical protein